MSQRRRIAILALMSMKIRYVGHRTERKKLFDLRAKRCNPFGEGSGFVHLDNRELGLLRHRLVHSKEMDTTIARVLAPDCGCQNQCEGRIFRFNLSVND